MKSAVLLLALGLCLNAFAQTSSRFRNEVMNNVAEHEERIIRSCEDIARDRYNAQPSFNLFDRSTWRGRYEISIQSDCFFNTKMRLMDGNISLALTRISRLTQRARERRDQDLLREVRFLQQGVASWRAVQAEERRRYQERDYGTLGRDYINETLRREIHRVLIERYEMRAEMRFEGTL